MLGIWNDRVVLETTDTDEPESYNVLGIFEEQPYCALFWYGSI